MNSTRIIETRPPSKRSEIEQSLRRAIVTSQLAPGVRMPTRAEIAVRFAAGPVTVQQAIDRLANDGFVVARGAKGTFVADHPPHLSRYGLVFAYSPARSRYWTALWNAAAGMKQAGVKQTIEVFDDVSPHSDDEQYRKLLAAVRNERLAGLIFANVPTEYRNTPLLTDPQLARAAVMQEGIIPGVAAIELDSKSFLDKALDYFASRGRRRLAVVAALHFLEKLGDGLVRDAARRGIELRPYWRQIPDFTIPEAVRSCVHLLMHSGQSERPDALLIADDNLVESATAGLVAAEVAVPRDVDVVAHCNFPWPPPSSTPVKRLGFDARRILNACIQSIDRQRAGDRITAVTRVPAQFEEELSVEQVEHSNEAAAERE